MFRFPFFAYQYKSLIIVIEASEREEFEEKSLGQDLAIHLVPIQDEPEILDILALSNSKILIIRQLSVRPDHVEEKIIHHLLLKGAQLWDISPFDQTISWNKEWSSKGSRVREGMGLDTHQWADWVKTTFQWIVDIMGVLVLGPVLLILCILSKLKLSLRRAYFQLKNFKIRSKSNNQQELKATKERETVAVFDDDDLSW